MKKKIFLAVSAIAGLVLLAVLGLGLFLDANQFRPQIEAALGGALGRKVSIGNVKVALFSGGMSIDDLTIADDPGLQHRSIRDGQSGHGRRRSDAADFFAEPARQIVPARGAAGRAAQFLVRAMEILRTGPQAGPASSAAAGGSTAATGVVIASSRLPAAASSSARPAFAARSGSMKT